MSMICAARRLDGAMRWPRAAADDAIGALGIREISCLADELHRPGDEDYYAWPLLSAEYDERRMRDARFMML